LGKRQVGFRDCGVGKGYARTYYTNGPKH
jgi:hypothetical protein